MRSNSAMHGSALLQRDRLLQRFEDESGALVPFMLMRAPAGSGKSTLAAQLIASAQGEGMRVYSARPANTEGETLWQTLGRSLTAEGEGIAAETDGAAAGYTQEGVHARLVALTEPTLIVLDNYHALCTVENDRALLELSQLNPHLRLCVLARSVRVLDGPLYRHRVRLICRQDLALTDQEQRDLAEQAGLTVSPPVAEALAQTAGWPVAVSAVINPGSGARPIALPAAGPHPELARLAIDLLHVLGQLDPPARTILLAASLVDGMTLEHAAELLDETVTATRPHVQTLLELGALASDRIRSQGLRVHPALRATLPLIAAREFSTSEQRGLVLRAARDVEKNDPADAFRIHIQESAFDEAERVLWRNFTMILDSDDASLAALRPLTDRQLSAHPLFAAVRFLLEFERPNVPPQRLWQTADMFHSGAQRRLESEPDPAHPLHIAHRMLVMIGERLHGNAPAALAIAQDIETHLTCLARNDQVPFPAPPQMSPGDQPAVLTEIAFTAFMGGDGALARRAWQRLDTLMELKPDGGAPREQISRATTRHGAWQHAALGGLALVESNEGDFRRAVRLLERADALRAEHGPAPTLAWVHAEIVRAHHAYEFRRPDMLRHAVDRITPWYDRIEEWPMVIMAEAESVRYQRGPDWALPHLRAAIAQVERQRHGVGVWGGYLALYQAMLNTTSGSFASSQRMIDSLPAKNSFVQIERARISLFRGDDVQALLTIQRLGAAALNLRQQIDALLIGAVAAWGCGRRQEAFVSLRDAGELIERCELSMMLRSVPFDPLVEVAAAARDAGVCDVTTLIDSIPEAARCVRRESLTHMEQRALESMATHPALADAALALDIAPATVKRHRLAVYRKLRVGSREEAILQAARMGLLPGHGTSS